MCNELSASLSALLLEPAAVIANEELLPKRTEHHRLQAFFLVAAMDELGRVLLEALQRRVQIPF